MERGEIIAAPTLKERVDAAKEHLDRSLEWKGERLGVVEMRRHYTNYFRGLRNVKHFRSKLVTEYDPKILHEIMDELYAYYTSQELAIA